jgi:hypothetical protein
MIFSVVNGHVADSESGSWDLKCNNNIACYVDKIILDG